MTKTYHHCLLLLLLATLPGWATSPPLDAGQLHPIVLSAPALSARQGVKNTVGTLALAGVLLLPADTDLSRGLRLPEGEHPDGVTDTFTALGTPQGLAPALGGLYLLGDDYDKESARLASVAMLNVGALVQGSKMLAGRGRPGTDHAGSFAGPTTRGEHSSFPSGHTATAFAVASVLADRYPRQSWIYYTLASGVGLARVRTGDHFPADVVIGAAVGLLTGRSTLQGGGRLLYYEF